MVEILIDRTKCVEPEKCGRCLKVCSPQIFAIHPEEEDAVYPRKWAVDPLWVTFCIQCNLCVKECPEHAISLK